MTASKLKHGLRGNDAWFPCNTPPAQPMWCDGRWMGSTFSFPVFWNGEKWESKVFGSPGDTWRERSSPPSPKKSRRVLAINLFAT